MEKWRNAKIGSSIQWSPSAHSSPSAERAPGSSELIPTSGHSARLRSESISYSELTKYRLEEKACLSKKIEAHEKAATCQRS